MLLQASINTFKKWFAAIVEILKTVSYEPAYHWVKGQNVRNKEYRASHVWFFFCWKMTILTSQSLSDIFVLIFYAQYLIFREQWVKELLSCHLWESTEIDFLLYRHYWWGRDKYFEKVLTSNARFDSVENSSPNPLQNLEM